MELHKQIKPENKYNISIQDNYLDYFDKSFKFVNEHYKEDLDRIINTKFEELTPEIFFREYCWTVATSGFNAKIVSKFFPRLMEIFNIFTTSYVYRVEDLNSIRKNALSIFNNKRKINAMIDCGKKIATHIFIDNNGWGVFKETYLNSIVAMTALPYIGSITAHHLARNLGIDTVKPDKHLVRMANHWGFKDPLEMCQTIQKKHNLPLGIIDLCLWYAASSFGSK